MKKIIFVFICLLISGDVYSKTQMGKSQSVRTHISVDSGYIPALNSNRAIGDFSVEYLQGTTTLMYKTLDSDLVRKNGVLAFPVQILFGFVLFPPIQLAYHEFGHGSRMKALGAEDEYGFIGYNGKFENNTYPNFWIYLPRAVIHPSTGGYTTTNESYKYNPKVFKDAYSSNIIVTAGGLNNNMRLSENLENEIYYNNGYSYYLWFYLYNKAHPMVYVYSESSLPGGEGDPSQLEASYKSKKYNIKKKDMVLANAASVLLSTTTYSLIIAYFEGGRVVKPVEVFGIRPPDTGFYMTQRGLSLKFNTGIRVEGFDFSIPIYYEKVVKGSKTDEWTTGLVYDHQWFSVSTLVRYNIQLDGKEAELFAELPLSIIRMEFLSVSAGLTHHDARTLNGVRNIPSYKKNTYEEIWTKVTYYY